MEEDIKNIERVIDYIQLESPIIQGIGNAIYTDSLKKLLKRYKEKEKELEKYKKIAEKLAEVVDFDRMDFNCSPLCIHDNCIEECALEWARKEVENE